MKFPIFSICLYGSRRIKNKDQGTKNTEQRIRNKDQGTKNKEQRSQTIARWLKCWDGWRKQVDYQGKQTLLRLHALSRQENTVMIAALV